MTELEQAQEEQVQEGSALEEQPLFDFDDLVNPEPEEEPGEEESEEEEVDEVEEQPKKKTRNQRSKEKIIALETRSAAVERERDEALERAKALEADLQKRQENDPLLNQILSNEELMAQARKGLRNDPPAMPEPPKKPHNYSRQRAVDEPTSEDARYLEENEDYSAKLYQWQQESEKYRQEQSQIAAKEQETRLRTQKQEQTIRELQTGLVAAAKNSSYVSAGDENEIVNQVIKFYSQPDSLSPEVMLNLFLATKYPRKPAKKSSPKASLPPPPSSAVSVSDSGFKQAGVDEQEAFEKEMLGE